ncbi:MAG: IclR family transcriptional regulator [Terriglobia bacterium]
MPNAPLATTRRVKRTLLETPSIQSLDRGLMILDTVAKSRVPVSLASLTAVLGIDRSSVFRLANTLKRRGFLANPSSGKEYLLGTSVWRLSQKYDWSRMLSAVAQEHLKLLAGSINETAHLAIREGSKAFFVDHCGARHVIAISGQSGEFLPLHCTSHGKALLADLDEKELRSLFGDTPLPRLTKNTIVSVAELVRECSRIRTRGYVTDEEEYMDGVRCLAAPIRDQAGYIIASIGVSAPVARFPPDLDKEYGARVMGIAQQIGELLGSPLP